MIRERENKGLPGLPMLLVLLTVCGLCFWGIVSGARSESDPLIIVLWSVLLLAALFLFAGLFVVNPNEGRVLQLFGDYRGTARVPGLRWANPFYTKKRISQ